MPVSVSALERFALAALKFVCSAATDELAASLMTLMVAGIASALTALGLVLSVLLPPPQPDMPVASRAKTIVLFCIVIPRDMNG